MITPAGPVRVFVAVPISPGAKRVLGAVLQDLGVQSPRGVRWVQPEAIHLTLKFLGNVETSLLPDIAEAMRRSAQAVAPFRITLSGLGMFPNDKRPRVLWAGIDGDLDSLLGLQQKIEQAMAELGFTPEGRPFSAHLTLGRVRDRASAEERRSICAAMSAASLCQVESWLVESAHLVRSHLAPAGATYTTLDAAPLGGFGADQFDP